VFFKLPGEEVFKVLAKHGVIVVPGDDFRVPGVDGSESRNANGEIVLRLSYAAPSPALIESGIARMVTGIKDALS
jgi:alanine-alpha-ketoisovalerate/valine-pyruvate aminotransferase